MNLMVVESGADTVLGHNHKSETESVFGSGVCA